MYIGKKSRKCLPYNLLTPTVVASLGPTPVMRVVDVVGYPMVSHNTVTHDDVGVVVVAQILLGHLHDTGPVL